MSAVYYKPSRMQTFLYDTMCMLFSQSKIIVKRFQNINNFMMSIISCCVYRSSDFSIPGIWIYSQRDYAPWLRIPWLRVLKQVMQYRYQYIHCFCLNQISILSLKTRPNKGSGKQVKNSTYKSSNLIHIVRSSLCARFPKK